MKFTIEYLPKKKIISLKMKGRLNFQFAEQYSKEALKLAHQNDCKKFFFDHSETTIKRGVNNLHMDGEELQQFGFKNTDMIAVVIANLGHEANLLENVNQNSRWSIVKYFIEDKYEEAFEWLMELEQK